MSSYNNLIFGCSGIIGSKFIIKISNKNSLFISKKKPTTVKKIFWQKMDLDKDNLKKLPRKVKTIFFFLIPDYIEKNLKKKNYFKKELLWVQNIIKNINCKKFVYTSSSSIYSQNHQIGLFKKKIENILLLSKIEIIQIWRPFSLVGFNNNHLSDHFHNILIKNIIQKKKKRINFQGSINDERGYSSVEKFCDEVYKKQKINKSFIFNYRNKNTIKLKKIIDVFNLALKKNKLKTFTYKFKNLKTNKNYDYDKLNNVKTIFSNENSEIVLYEYFNNVINNEKKL